MPNKRRSLNCGRVAEQFAIFALLNSKVNGPIFTKLLHDVEALVLLLIRTFTKDLAFCFGMLEQKNEDGQFRICKKAPKLIGYHSNVPSNTAKLISVL